MRAVIDAFTAGFPIELTEVRRLGRTLKKRAADVLAYFHRPGTSNGTPEAINGRLEHTCAAPPSASETSPTTSPEHSSRPEASDPSYTLDCEEPVKDGECGQVTPAGVIGVEVAARIKRSDHKQARQHCCTCKSFRSIGFGFGT